MEYQYKGEFDLSAVKDNFLALTDGRNPFKSNKGRMTRMVSDWSGRNFYGSTIPDMREYCVNGFPLSIPAINVNQAALTRKRKFIRAEEGELILEAAYSGEDFPFIAQTKRPARPGLKIVAEYSTLSSTPESALAAYGRFIGELCALYQGKGYDLGISVSMPGFRRFSNVGKTETLITLKREGILADPVEWSAMFSPGGYRMLGFLSHAMLGDKIGKVLMDDCGATATAGEFDAKFDRATRTLRLEAPRSYDTFPAPMMRDKIERLGI